MADEKNRLYYGDNLEVLREYVATESVDLIYLDPPFNSRQDHNVLFAEKDGNRSAAQITAFKDTWEWNEEAARSYAANLFPVGAPRLASETWDSKLIEDVCASS